MISGQWEGDNERPPFWVKRFLSPMGVKCGPGSVGENLTNTATGTHMVLWEHAVCIKGNTHVFIWDFSKECFSHIELMER